VFYVFPLVGTSRELAQNAFILPHTWLLDVADLVALPPPTRRDGAPRKTELHYVDVFPHVAIIHSHPVEVPVLNLLGFSKAGFPRADGVRERFESFEQFWEFRRGLARHSAAIMIPF